MGTTYTVIGTFASKGTAFGGNEDNIIMVPITRFLMDFGAENYTVNIATQAPSQIGLQRDDGQGHRRDAHRPRPAARAGE